MKKTYIILTLGSGDFNTGFDVDLQIGYPENPNCPDHSQGKLPPRPELCVEHEKWRSAYSALFLGGNARMIANSGTCKNGGELMQTLTETSDHLKENLNHWLNHSNDFSKIRSELIKFFTKYPRAFFFLKIDNDSCSGKLQSLPWHLWSLFIDDFKEIELALVPAEFKGLDSANLSKLKWFNLLQKKSVKILAIFGNSQDLNLSAEKEELEKLGVQVEVELKRTDFLKKLREDDWDVFFFAGHSNTKKERGGLWINDHEYLELQDVKNSFREAIERGLKLAIFNSCRGLGLAKDLQELNIPEVVVMRELVPDRVAQEFFKHFLHYLKSGKTTALALRKTREFLIDQGLDKLYPGVTWLPILCANPAADPFIWKPEFTRFKLPNPVYLINLIMAMIVMLFVIQYVKGQLKWQPCAEELKVHLKCPTDWQQQAVFNAMGIRLVNQKLPGSEITFHVEDVPETKDLESYTPQTLYQISKNAPQSLINNPTDTKLGRYLAKNVYVTMNGIPQKQRYVWTVINHRAYVFSLTKSDNQTTDLSGEEEKIFAQILWLFEPRN